MSSDKDTTPVATGRDIILTIGKTMHEGLEPLLTRTLAPSLYQVYLHPADYDRLRTVFQEIERDARKHLDDELARLNRQSQASPLARLNRAIGKKLDIEKPQMEYVSTDGQWSIKFQEDPDERLAAGEVEVVTELAVGEEAGYGSGKKTHRIISTTRRLGKMETHHEVSEIREEEPSTPRLARFRFEDDSGPHVYTMRQDEIVIGRKAEDVRVDLDLDTALDVSREHARVRHRGGRFMIKDLSTYGTKINGQSIRSSIVIEDGQERDLDHWEELPDGAQIELASIVTLGFEIARS